MIFYIKKIEVLLEYVDEPAVAWTGEVKTSICTVLWGVGTGTYTTGEVL